MEAAAAAAPLHSWSPLRRTRLNRAFALLYSFAILSLLYHHFLNLTTHHSTTTTSTSTTTSLSMLLADLVPAFMWVTYQAFRMKPINRETFPENLIKHAKESEFPAVDVLIWTADSFNEPPMRVVNTCLSVMAYDYPTPKLSFYVSDDGGSQLTLFAFMEAAKFAAHWLPFCKKNRIVKRCPEAYFASDPTWFSDIDQIQNMYESMKMRVERGGGAPSFQQMDQWIYATRSSYSNSGTIGDWKRQGQQRSCDAKPYLCFQREKPINSPQF